MVLPKCPCQVAAVFGVDLDGRTVEISGASPHTVHDHLPYRNDECHCHEECTLMSDCSQEDEAELSGHDVHPIELEYGAENLSNVAIAYTHGSLARRYSSFHAMPPPRCRYCIYRL